MSEHPPAMDLSIVIPVYNAEGTIDPLVRELLRTIGTKQCLQVILVNDGSRDRSHEVCRKLVEDFPKNVTYLRLSRNFGEHNAVMAGLRHALGEFVIIMDDDGQQQPADALRLYEEARSSGCDLVYSQYPKKAQPLFRNLGSWFNGRVANWMLDKPKDLYLCSFKCMSRWLVKEVTRYHGPFPYVDGLALRCTQNLRTIVVEHGEREQGRSGYTLRKLVRLWLSMFFNFSLAPLRASIYLGFLLVALGAILAVAVVLEWGFFGSVPKGWPSLAIMVMLFSGTQLVMLGVIGEYLGRMFLASNETPQYAVRERMGLGAGEVGPHTLSHDARE